MVIIIGTPSILYKENNQIINKILPTEIIIGATYIYIYKYTCVCVFQIFYHIYKNDSLHSTTKAFSKNVYRTYYIIVNKKTPLTKCL